MTTTQAQKETHFQVRMLPEIQLAIRVQAESLGWTVRQTTEALIMLGLQEMDKAGK